jgi:parallel beta-helix repeat protein
MKNKGKLVSLLLSVLLVSLILSYTPQTTDLGMALNRGAEHNSTQGILNPQEFWSIRAGISHAPIFINSDSNFTDTVSAEGWDGEGTEEYPYIIEGYDIDRNGEDGHCIWIENTTVHFVIRDCYLANANQTDRAGILLNNVSNCRIENNIFYKNVYGISAWTEHCTIIDNQMVGNEIVTDNQIWLYIANQTSVIGNSINGSNYGIRGVGCQDTMIEGNIVRDGNNYGFSMGISTNTTLIDNAFINNNVMGISIEVCDEATLIRNFCNDSMVGIYFVDITDCIISGCTLEDNDQGFLITNGNNILCTDSRFQDSTFQGVQISGSTSSNHFQWNTFKNNPTNFESISSGNDLEYCYYDDYTGTDVNDDGFGDTPYTSAGPVPAVDDHPLVYDPAAPVWSPSPMDQLIEYGQPLNYQLNVASASPIVDWSICDTADFLVDDNGVVSNKAMLETGTHPVGVTATNIYGFSVSGSFTVTVEDTTDPVWITHIVERQYMFGTPIEFQVSAWDLAGIQSWVLSDTENFTLAEISFADTGIATITGDTNLAVGVYPIALSAYDAHGNVATAEFTVTITEATPPPGGTDGSGFIVSTVGLGIAVMALIMALVSLITTRKRD